MCPKSPRTKEQKCHGSSTLTLGSGVEYCTLLQPCRRFCDAENQEFEGVLLSRGLKQTHSSEYVLALNELGNTLTLVQVQVLEAELQLFLPQVDFVVFKNFLF